ncbi:M48 family metalloprotease [Actinoplanes sp. NPDC051470]|uniref:M48 family metalloprotease n=1 Tax=unclassified Actinoplanes TaxID=2626549 RepID=UPI00342A5048
MTMAAPRLPSPGVARYGAILLLLAAAGLFAGQTTFNALQGPRWLKVVKGCAAGRPLDAVPDVATSAIYLRCVSAVEQDRAGYTFAGALAVLLLGAMLMVLLPYRLLRRAGPLRPAEAEIAGRFAEAARRLRLPRPPAVFFGGGQLQEAFTVRTLRGTRIILPRGLRRLPPGQIDAVLRHEAAHVRAGDVTLVWLTRGMWWALIPALLTPLLLINLPILLTYRAELADDPLGALRSMFARAFYLNYTLRSLLLLLVAATVAAAVLRSREHEADLAAAAGDEAGLRGLLGDAPAPRPSWWRRLQAIHPSPRRRLQALDDPHRTMELRPLDAAAAGLLIAMMTPVLHLALPVNPDNGVLSQSTHLTGLVAGILFALAWGTALWRAALVAERTGRPMRLRATSVALAAATAAGLLAHVAGTPAVGQGVFDSARMLAMLPPAIGAAATVAGLLARAWARRTAGAPVAGPTWAAIAVLNTLLFTGALWISCDIFSLVPASGGWAAGVRDTLGYYAMSRPGALTVVVLGVLAFRWTADRPGRSRAALLVLVPAAAALAVRWLVVTSPADQATVLHRDLWAMMAAGGAVVAVLLARRGAAGLVPAMALAPAATLLIGAAIWLRWAQDWGHPGAAAGQYLTSALAALGPVYLAGGLIALLLPARRRHPQ